MRCKTKNLIILTMLLLMLLLLLKVKNIMLVIYSKKVTISVYHFISQITNLKCFVLIIYYKRGQKRWIKNWTCDYFDDITRAWDIHIDTDFSGILLDKKLYKEKKENISIYVISCKTLTGSKPLSIRYNK